MGRRRASPIATGTGNLTALRLGVPAESTICASMNPSDLYACYAWTVAFQAMSVAVHSPIFSVCGTQWVLSTSKDIEIIGCMALSLRVANPDRLLPGWSQYVQLTISAINKDSEKSIHCDGFHRFSAREHDYGWNDFMRSSEIEEGFIVGGSIAFEIQVQLLREKPFLFSSCLDEEYRRELFFEMGAGMWSTCFNFINKQKCRITDLRRNSREFERFSPFYLSLESGTRQNLSQERTHVICQSLVEYFLEGEDTNTAVLIEMLHLGMKALENGADHNTLSVASISVDDASGQIVSIKDGKFFLADHLFKYVNNFFQDDQLWNYDQIMRLKDRLTAEDAKEECHEALIIEIGRWTLEIFVIIQIFCEKMYPKYLLELSLAKQEELLKELEAERESDSKKHSKNKKKQTAKKRKDGGNKAKNPNHKPLSDPEIGEPEDAPLKLEHETLESSVQHKREHDGINEENQISHVVETSAPLLKEPMASDVKTENLSDRVELHMDVSSLHQSDATWTRKERKKSRAVQGIKQSRDSNKISDKLSKEHQNVLKDHSVKEHFLKQYPSASAKDPEREKLKQLDASNSIADLVSAQSSKSVDLNPKSWADFRLGFTFESLCPKVLSFRPFQVPSSCPSQVPSSSPVEVPSACPYEVPSSCPSEVFPFMNMINYILDEDLETKPFDSYFSVSIDDVLRNWKWSAA